MLDLLTIPCLKDNYAYLLHDAATGHTTLVDAPEAAPILAALKARDWTLSQIVLTHHHSDHIQGVPDLVEATGAAVLGAMADAHRMPALARALVEGDSLEIGPETAHILDVSGHTMGHIAIILPGYAFTADSLMAGGCGRLFEGTPGQMWVSLAKLAALPPETLICSGHEYTTANLRFAATIEPDNQALQTRIADTATARAAGLATVPSTLAVELATNPFLRAPTLEAFTEIRARKDKF